MSNTNIFVAKKFILIMKKLLLWIGALLIGTILGLLQVDFIDVAATFVATIYTRLFQLLAVPIIVLAIITTLASLGKSAEAGRIFGRTIIYTLLTTLVASLVGLALFVAIEPGVLSLPASDVEGSAAVQAPSLSYTDHILSVVPNNVVRPFLEGNVLSLLLLAAAVGIALSHLPVSESRTAVLNFFQGLQDVIFLLIKALIWALPLGIVAFAAQLASQLSAGVVADSIGKYVLVVLGGNLVQFFVVLPLFLLSRGLNPVRTLRLMLPAVLMALFTKSSAATLPVTISSAENRLKVNPKVSRFVLPICTTINMNGCAAFILVTSLFVLQQGGVVLTWPLMLTWVLISVVSAVGNAGVPMGCYFLTLSLMSGMGVPVAVMGIILPIYTIIDMVETAVNVWSDSCVCALTNHDLKL